MKPPTKALVAGEIKALRAIAEKPTFRKNTMFGDSNKDAIEAQIETLERKFTHDECDNREGEEWTEHVAGSARDAASWLWGDTKDLPSKGWDGLH